MYYVVLDLEMCKVPKNYRSYRYRYAREIIQIGAVLLDEKFNRIDTFSQYVKPTHGKVDNFIMNLTGIKNFQLKDAPNLADALQNMVAWIGDKEYRVYTWSENDYDQLLREVVSKEISAPEVDEFMNMDRWFDYQAIFDERFDYEKQVGLEDALMLCAIDPQGRFHDGLDDAINTAILISKLEREPDFQLTKFEYVANSEPVNTCLGELFGKLNLNIA